MNKSLGVKHRRHYYVADCRGCGASLEASTRLGRLGNQLSHFTRCGRWPKKDGEIWYDE